MSDIIFLIYAAKVNARDTNENIFRISFKEIYTAVESEYTSSFNLI